LLISFKGSNVAEIKKALLASVNAELEAIEALGKKLEAISKTFRAYRLADQGVYVIEAQARDVKPGEALFDCGHAVKSVFISKADDGLLRMEIADEEADSLVGRLVSNTAISILLAVRDSILQREITPLTKAMLDREGEGKLVCSRIDDPKLEGFTKSQRKAISAATSNEVTFILGPPGTGKTKTIGEIVRRLRLANERVLIVSNAHLAVERAFEEIVNGRFIDESELSLDSQSKRLERLNIANKILKKRIALEEEKVMINNELNDVITMMSALNKAADADERRINNALEKKVEAEALVLEKERRLISLQEERSIAEEQLQRARNNVVLKLLSAIKGGHSQGEVELESKIGAINAEIEIVTRQKNGEKFEAERLAEAAKIIALNAAKTADARKEAADAIDAAKNRITLITLKISELDAEKIITESNVVGATLSAVAIAKRFEKQSFDAVVVDEASMANLPTLALSASLATKRVIIVGDPAQLSPVARTDGLKRSIYENNEIGYEKSLHPLAVMLQEQFRCHETICELTSKIFYNGMLKNGREKGSFDNEQALFFANRGAIISSRMIPVVGGSYVNPVHRQIIRKQVENALKRGRRSIGIISPFKVQAKEIDENLHDLRASYEDADVESATIHRFQGAERDVIIFDLVVGTDRKIPKMLLGEAGSEAGRLLNVAATRAKGFLVVVCDVASLITGLKETVGEEAYERQILYKWIMQFKALSETEVVSVIPAETSTIVCDDQYQAELKAA
jgi:superfamily I DNA and/or RNA helicase